MQLYWPEGQPTLVDRLEQFGANLSLAAPDDLVADDLVGSDNGMGKSMDGLKAIKDDFDALSNEVQQKVDALKGEIKDEMREMKDLIYKLMGMMSKE